MNQMPRLGFGTWKRKGNDGIEAIDFALETGYRHIDTAQSYENEKEVGIALKNCGIPRAEIWVTTKVDMSNFDVEMLIPSLDVSLQKLGGPVDLALIHWPSPHAKIPLHVYMEQILDAKQRGMAHHIGVSNFPIALMAEAEEIIGKNQILTNQFELNPGFQNRRLADFCQRQGVLVTCYQPIAQGRMDAVPQIQKVAEAHNATPSQITLAWELQKGYATIPTSSKRERIAANFAALDLHLSKDEMILIDGVAQTNRAIDPEWGPEWDL